MGQQSAHSPQEVTPRPIPANTPNDLDDAFAQVRATFQRQPSESRSGRTGVIVPLQRLSRPDLSDWTAHVWTARAINPRRRRRVGQISLVCGHAYHLCVPELPKAAFRDAGGGSTSVHQDSCWRPASQSGSGGTTTARSGRRDAAAKGPRAGRDGLGASDRAPRRRAALCGSSPSA